MRAAWAGSDPNSRLTSIPGYLHSLSLFRKRIKNFFKMILSKCDVQLDNIQCPMHETKVRKKIISLNSFASSYNRVLCLRLLRDKNSRQTVAFIITEPLEQCHQQYPAGQFEHYCSDIICGYWLNTSLSISRLLTFSGPIGLGANFQFFNNPWLCWNRGALINNKKQANLQGF